MQCITHRQTGRLDDWLSRTFNGIRLADTAAGHCSQSRRPCVLCFILSELSRCTIDSDTQRQAGCLIGHSVGWEVIARNVRTVDESVHGLKSAGSSGSSRWRLGLLCGRPNRRHYGSCPPICSVQYGLIARKGIDKSKLAWTFSVPGVTNMSFLLQSQG